MIFWPATAPNLLSHVTMATLTTIQYIVEKA